MSGDEQQHELASDEGVTEAPEETKSFVRWHDVSDVVLAESSTGAAPSFPAPALPATERAVRPAKQPMGDKAPLALLPGARVDDFEVVRLLGRGAFGHVYLARQISLDRLVALKVSANRGSEGRTMARLEHQHIVQVFSEKVDPDFNQRLLCMQLVPGIGLEKLIASLHEGIQGEEGAQQKSQEASASTGDTHWTGAELLGIVDRAASLPSALDPSALHDREALAEMDAVEATAWFGGRLAEALDFAHHHGVLHRDIKPANILVNSYGRPLLADFNISSQPVGSEPSGDEMFGGTFAYMAPEHLDAFNPEDATGQDAVTERSDLYSLGLVLRQLLEGRMRLPMTERRTRLVDTIRRLSAARRNLRPTAMPGPPGARKTLERTIARCLEPDPDRRFSSGAELAAQLDGCRRLRGAERQLPAPPAVLAPLLRRPFLWLIVLVLIPQVIGSVVNITYNKTQIVDRLDEAQREFFDYRLVPIYNLVVYPAAIALLVYLVRSVWRSWQALSGVEEVPEAQVVAARRLALRLPRWIAAMTAAGWFPGGVLFPLAISFAHPPLSLDVGMHFVASFWLSGLVALAYSLCGAQFIVLRALYPAMWVDVRNFRATAQDELATMSARLSRIHLLAGSIPLVAAVLLLMIGQGGDSEDRSLAYLATGLIVLGMFGSHFASAVLRSLSQVVSAMTSTKE